MVTVVNQPVNQKDLKTQDKNRERKIVQVYAIKFWTV